MKAAKVEREGEGRRGFRYRERLEARGGGERGKKKSGKRGGGESAPSYPCDIPQERERGEEKTPLTHRHKKKRKGRSCVNRGGGRRRPLPPTLVNQKTFFLEFCPLAKEKEKMEEQPSVVVAAAASTLLPLPSPGEGASSGSGSQRRHQHQHRRRRRQQPT